MRRLRANLALVIWFAIFAAILILWAGSQWRYCGIVLLRDRSPANTGYDGYGIASEGHRLFFFSHRIDRGASNASGIHFLFRVPDPPQSRDFGWGMAVARVHLGVARWYKLFPNPGINTMTVRIIDIHYAFLAAVAGFFTWRSWRKRRRQHARGFAVVDAR